MSTPAESIRLPLPEDAIPLNDIYIDRRYDIVPGSQYNAYNASIIAFYHQFGAAEFASRIAQAQANPVRFARVAARNKRPIGFVEAEVLYKGTEVNPPGLSRFINEDIVMYTGLFLAREYEGWGLGGALEAARRAWVREIGRPALTLVVKGNVRPMQLLQGFTQIGELDPTPKIPLAFNVLKLPKDLT
jgi:GNAT superfamily N-acetyltransferase